MCSDMNRHTRSIPLLVDNSLNRAMSIKYALFSLFGLAGFITDIPSITEVSGAFIASIVGLILFFSAGFASLSAWHTERGAGWRKIETYASITFICFCTVYSADLIYLTINGSHQRTGVTVLSLALLVMPIWRVRYLIRRARVQ